MDRRTDLAPEAGDVGNDPPDGEDYAHGCLGIITSTAATIGGRGGSGAVERRQRDRCALLRGQRVTPYQEPFRHDSICVVRINWMGRIPYQPVWR